MRTVFFDVDTQLDFLSPAGALYVPGAERIASSLAALTTFAAAHHIQIVSSIDTHSENDPEFELWKPHCVRGTYGHQKFSGTLLPRPSSLQVLFEKDTIDFFARPEVHRLLATFQPERFVVYGLVTEYCVRSAAMGLLARNVRVELVTDAIKSLHAAEERLVLEQFQTQGGHLVTADKILSSSPS